MSIEEIKQVRLEKMRKLKDFGMDPYPSIVPRDLSLKEAVSDFESLVLDTKEKSITGRIMAIRGQGAILFVVLDDGSATFQAVFKKDTLDEKLFNLFVDAIDIGDFISATGVFFKTERGQESILVSSFTIATKTLLPLPDKWHGIEDEDERYRKRYLDMLQTPELRLLLLKKAKFWDVTREFMKDQGFTEVETPTLEVTTGGAEANPFKTHHKDFDINVYLRISIGELWQKRLMAGNFPKTFEIGRAYRNEGTSPEHLQEFTNMEFYWSFANYKDGMIIVEALYKKIALEVFGQTKFTTRGHSFDFSDEWKKVSYVLEVKKQTDIDVLSATEEEMKSKLEELGVKFEGSNRERLMDSLWKYCRKNISGPAFLVHHPKIVSPLAKE